MLRENYGFMTAGLAAGATLSWVVLGYLLVFASDLHLLFSVFGGLAGLAFCCLILSIKKMRQRDRIRQQTEPAKPRLVITQQAVGKTCSNCRESIVSAHEGFVCTVCDSVFCVKCEPRVPCSSCDGQYALVQLVSE